MDELIDHGFVLEQRATSLRRGGVPRLLSISVGNDFIVGIDIEVSHSTVVLADLMGRTLELDILATPMRPVDVVAALADCLYIRGTGLSKIPVSDDAAESHASKANLVRTLS